MSKEFISSWNNYSNNEFNNSFVKLEKLLSKYHHAELISRLFVIQNDKFQTSTGYNVVLPLHQEYITGLLCRTNITSGKSIASYKDVLEIIKLIDKLHQNWIINNYTRKIAGATDESELLMKIFEADMISNYGTIRGYSWFATISLNQINELFIPLKSDLKRHLGFCIDDVLLFLESWKKLIRANLNSLYYQYSLSFEIKDIDIPITSLFTEIKKEDFFKDTYFFDSIKFNGQDLLKFCDNEEFKKNPSPFEAILSFFSFHVNNINDSNYKYFSDSNIYNLKPIIKFDDDYLIQNLQHFEMKIKDSIVEEIKKNNKLWNKFLKKRGDFLESKTKDLLQKVFSKENYYSSLYYDLDGEQFELDGLIEFDNTLLLIEAKSGQYHSAAKRGGIRRLKDNISDNIEYAALQALRSKKYILSSSEVIFTDKKRQEALRIKHSNYQEIYVLNITLEYFAELAVDLQKLSKLNLYQDGYFPLSVSVNDLEVITEYLSDPYEFIHYIHFRTSYSNYLKKGQSISYELDLLAYYCLDYSFTKDMVTANLDIPFLILNNPAPLSVLKEISLNNRFNHEIVDASPLFNSYYNNKVKGTLIPLKKRVYSTRSSEIINKLKSYDNKSNLSFLLYFLELNHTAQAKLDEYINRVFKLYTNDKKDHNISIHNFFDEKHSNRTCGCTIFIAHQKYRGIVLRNAKKWCIKKKQETSSTDWIGIIYFVNDYMNYRNDFILTGDSLYGIDNIAKNELGDKVGRNDPCPCKSGLKYKKCHGKI